MTTETIGLDLDGLRQTIAANHWRADALEIFGDLIAEVERLRNQIAVARERLEDAQEEFPAVFRFYGMAKALEALK